MIENTTNLQQIKILEVVQVLLIMEMELLFQKLPIAKQLARNLLFQQELGDGLLAPIIIKFGLLWLWHVGFFLYSC